MPQSDLERLTAPVRRTTWRFYAVVAPLAAIVALGAYAYYVQFTTGLGVTGMRDYVSWGLYISNFVFFIGVSHAGTLISAILRVSGAEWRKPITRMAESITVIAISVGALFPIIDLGHPDRILNLLFYGRIQSAVLWDFISIATYLTGSLLYLYLPLIPDLAAMREAKVGGRFRRALYGFLSMKWRDHPGQRWRLKRGIAIMAVLIIPIAVSVHTVVSWIFGMTLRVGWHSTIFGPYFVVGAILSGIATIILAMAVFRKVYHLEKWIKPLHFRNLGLMMLALDLILVYFTLSEYLTAAYGSESADTAWLNALAFGPYAYLFWGMVVGGLLAPVFILALTRVKSVAWLVVAAVCVNVGMWFERLLIVVPAMATPQMPVNWASYSPTWVEWSITAGAIAGFVLLYAVFSKLFPLVSVWEVSEETPEAKPTPRPVGEEVTP
ncbi:MAG TPA: NrfD/PsrC family molybdoenzyme membrane anchor subunit [Thermoplasmata archaeon]|nr:NrfD/PsrC family molybdoenzyme membrane anchor subunit [Thermoplasmata archaeon]